MLQNVPCRLRAGRFSTIDVQPGIHMSLGQLISGLLFPSQYIQIIIKLAFLSQETANILQCSSPNYTSVFSKINCALR